MRTARLLTYPGGGGCLPRGVCIKVGVCQMGGLSRGVCIQGVCPRGSAWGGIYPRRGRFCIQGGLPGGSLHPGGVPMREVGQTPLWTEWHTGVKTLPCPKLHLWAVTRMHSSSGHHKMSVPGGLGTPPPRGRRPFGGRPSLRRQSPPPWTNTSENITFPCGR